MDPERSPFPSEPIPPVGAWPDVGPWPPAATISGSSPSKSLGGSSSEPSCAQSPAPMFSLGSLGRVEAGLEAPFRGARWAGSRGGGGVGGPGPGGPWGGRASSGAELCLSTSMAPRRCSSSAPSGGRRAASGPSSCGRCALSSSFWRSSSADISSLAVGSRPRRISGLGSAICHAVPRPRGAGPTGPGSASAEAPAAERASLPGQGAGSRNLVGRGHLASWSRAAQGRPGLSLASTRAGAGPTGALMDAGLVTDEPARSCTDSHPGDKGSHTRLLLTWGLAQGRGHPQEGGPEVGAQGDVGGIRGRQQGGRLRQLPVDGRAVSGERRRPRSSPRAPPPSRNCGPRSGRLC